MPNVDSPSPNLSAYEVARQKRIQFIQNEIRKIGVLKKIKTSQTEMRHKLDKPKKKRQYAKKSPKQVSSRASPRLAGKKVEYTRETVDSFGMHIQIRDKNGNKVSVRKIKKKAVSKKMLTPMTQEEKEKLESMKGTIDKFESFLIGLGDSEQNRRQVLRQARKLLSGQGVEHPRNDAFFRRNDPVHLGCNFRDLISDAWDFENTYGEDYGHGWLLRHPLKKLWLFQNHMRFETTEVRSKEGQSGSPDHAKKMSKQKYKSSVRRSTQSAAKRKREERTFSVGKRRSKRITQPKISKDFYHKRGTRVSVRWNNGKKYTATVTSVSKSSPRKHTIVWDGDGAETVNLRYSQLRPIEIE